MERSPSYPSELESTLWQLLQITPWFVSQLSKLKLRGPLERVQKIADHASRCPQPSLEGDVMT